MFGKHRDGGLGGTGTGVWEAQEGVWEAQGKRLGGTGKAFGRHMEGVWEALGRGWKACYRSQTGSSACLNAWDCCEHKRKNISRTALEFLKCI